MFLSRILYTVHNDIIDNCDNLKSYEKSKLVLFKANVLIKEVNVSRNRTKQHLVEIILDEQNKVL